MKLQVMNYICLWIAFLGYYQVAMTKDDKEKNKIYYRLWDISIWKNDIWGNEDTHDFSALDGKDIWTIHKFLLNLLRQ